MMPTTQRLLDIAASGGTIIDSESHTLFGASKLETLLGAARQRRDQAHVTVVSYSPKVFIPLTKLCRDVCRYCTFAEAPRRGEQAYLSIEEAIDIARAGAFISIDADGYVTYGGRADDMLKIGGKWLSPKEVENCLLAHDDVREVAVVGVKTADGLVKPSAFVIPAAGVQGPDAPPPAFAGGGGGPDGPAAPRPPPAPARAPLPAARRSAHPRAGYECRTRWSPAH